MTPHSTRSSHISLKTEAPAKDNVDPVLEKLVTTATFDCDWPTLRDHLCAALLGTLPVFLAHAPTRTPFHRTPSPATPPPLAPSVTPRLKGETPPGNSSSSPSSTSTSSPSIETSTLLSPVRPFVHGWSPDEPSDGVPAGAEGINLTPSTHGGLVIPPFPPLDPKRRMRGSMMGGPGGSPRLNGAQSGTRGGMGGNPFEDEWDEEVVIGGRKLEGWMDEGEGKREATKVVEKLEELTFAPFTVQRLAELLVYPRKHHSSLGKFLRAVEKTLNVTTPYAPPSYNYVPSYPNLTGSGSQDPHASPRTGAIDLTSTVPPGSTTPMFSPVPFLTTMPGSGDIDMGSAGHLEEGLMSPLVLSSDSQTLLPASSLFMDQQHQNRSPTPEPEDEVDMSAATSSPSASTSSSPSSSSASASASTAVHDPGHQPYLGRVDELDAGPLTSNGHGPGSKVDEDREARDGAGVGLGEGGNMTPHGMSERPVPLSSTTVIEEAERDIARLPRAGGTASGDGVAAVNSPRELRAPPSLSERFVGARGDEAP